MGSAVLVTCLVAGGSALAQQSDAAADPRAQARALGEEGLIRFREGDFKGALARFDDAEALVRMPTLSVRAARCLERLGRWVEAADRFQATTLLSVDDSLPEEFREAQRVAKQEAEAERRLLLVRIPTVLIRSAGVRPDLVTLDGTTLPAADWDKALPVDPGGHEIVARYGERSEPWSVTARPREQIVVELRLDAPRPAPVPARSPVRPSPAPQRIRGNDELVIAGATLLSAAGVASAIGIGAWVVVMNAQSDLDRLCGSGRECTASELGPTGRRTLATHDDATTATVASFVTAGVFLTAGVSVLVPGLVVQSDEGPLVSVHVAPTMLEVHGVF